MRASELDMKELLNFQPEQGKILLKDSRVIVFDTAALGKLRKDLIDTLGMDRAKGFLIRYGWSCGYEAAMSIKEQFEWDNELEWIYAGPTMHTLEGFVAVKPSVIDIDRQKGTWLLSGIWSNSFEAEQHVLHFGHHNETVCWMLVGYAGGYGSAYLGKKVIYKEITCVGKGDEHCSFIGRTLEEWGDEISSELPYYEVSKISEELEAANRRIKTQNRILEQAVTVHEQLTQCILQGKGVEDITANLAELLKCTVVLENRDLTPRYIFSKHPADEVLLKPYLDVSSSPSFTKASKHYLKQRRPFQITDEYLDFHVFRLVSPIIVGNELHGFISLLRIGFPFQELEIIALEHAASVFALAKLEGIKIAEVERRLKGDFIEDLLSGKFSDNKSIINRALGLQYDITLPHRVVLFDIHDFSRLIKSLKHNETKILHFKTELVNTIQSCLNQLGKGMVVNKSDIIIMLVQQTKQDNTEIFTTQLAEKILKHVSDRFPKVTLTVGIGSSCSDLSDFHRSFQSAQKAIEIGKALNKHGQVISLEQFGAHALLFSAINPKDLYSFATSQIGALLAYDGTYQAQLIPTLEEFLNHRGNIEGTARTMNMSISGLKYRVQRIEEIAGQNLKDSKACFNLQLALNIMQLAGKDQIISQLKS
jgi:sugar diacid utilization regulator